jgi:hypothetical protein
VPERLTILRGWLHPRIEKDYYDMVYHALVNAYDTHPKRELRIQAVEELIDSGKLGERLWLRSVLYKMKKDELAKPGKWPRMIGDLGVAASLQGFYVTDALKGAMASEPLRYKGFEIEFVKAPKQDALTRVFEKLLNPPGNGYIALFSDDSCASVRLSDGRVAYGNLDISSCDASHTDSIFEFLVAVAPPHMQDDIRRLVEQCRLPIKIRDVNMWTRFVRLVNKNKEAALYSGSTLTTFINNLANILIAMSVAEDYEVQQPTTFQDLAISALKVGYVVTCEEAQIPEDIQFLKFSPVIDTNGNMQPMLNLGVLLRASGCSKGDVPGPKGISLEERAAVFQKAVLRGMYPYCDFQLLTELRRHCDTKTSIASVEAYAKKHLPYTIAEMRGEGHHQTYQVDNVALARRYRLKDSELLELELLVREAGYGYQIQCAAVDKILRLDYGLRSEF